MRSLTLLSLLPASSLATKMLLPLYQYPSATAYSSVYATIEANPQLFFQIILNVDSGPGGPKPDAAFADAASKMTAYPNVELLGYLHCGYGAASPDQVAKNASDWAAWNAYAGATVSINGIFFDETPNSQGSAGADDVAFMQTLVGSAKSAFGTHAYIGMFNPGSAIEHEEYWTLADYNVIFEDVASAYSDAILTTNIPAGKANQSSILIPEFASVGSETQAESWLQAMKQAGVGSAHILNYGYIQATSSVSPAPIGAVAKVLAAGAQVSSASASSSATAVVSSSTAKASSSTAVVVDPSTTQKSSSAVDVSSTVAVTPSEASRVPSSVVFSSSTKSSVAVLPTSFTTSYITKTLSVTAVSPTDSVAPDTRTNSTSTVDSASITTFSAVALPTPASESQDTTSTSTRAYGIRPGSWDWLHRHPFGF